MAGARIGPISGVNWAAYGNVASLIMQAAEASARGSAALGAGIGGGLQSLGQGIQRGRERREARAERQEARADSQARWEAEFGYRQQRDAADDTRADRALEMNSANIAADNERASVASRLAMLRTLSEGYSQAMDVANQTGDGTAYQQAQTGLQSALSAMQGLAGGLQNPQPFQQTAAFGAPPPAPAVDTGLGSGVGAAPARVRPAAPGAPETPSQAFERKSREMSAELEGQVDSGRLRSIGPVELPPAIQNLVRGFYLNEEAKRLRKDAASVMDKSPRGQIERSARLRAALVVESQAAAPAAAAKYAIEGRGMAVEEAQLRQRKSDEAKKKADEADVYNKELDLRVKGAFAAFRAKFGRDPTPEEAPLILDQVRAKITPDAAVENFVKPTKTGDSDEEMRKAGAERLKSIDSEAGKIRDVLSRNSQPKASGGEVYDLGQHTNLGAYSTEALVSAWANTANEQTRAFYEKELGSRKDTNEAKRAVASLRFSNLPKAEQTKEKWDKIKASLGL